MYITAIHRPSRKLRGGICRYETFWMGIFERTTFLLLRCRSIRIHVKLCVLQTFQLSRILRETHAFDLFLTLTRIDTILSRKSEKNIESIHLFVLTYLFASESLYLAESVALKYVTCQ